MSTSTRVIKNTGFLYGKMAITVFISLYSTRLILNALGASDYGVFNVVGGAIAMLGFLNGAMASGTPAFTTLQSAMLPIRKAGSHGTRIVLVFFVVGFLVTTIYALYKEGELKKLLGM